MTTLEKIRVWVSEFLVISICRLVTRDFSWKKLLIHSFFFPQGFEDVWLFDSTSWYMKTPKFLQKDSLNSSVSNGIDLLLSQKDRSVTVISIFKVFCYFPAHFVKHLCSSSKYVLVFISNWTVFNGIRVSPCTFSNTIRFDWGFRTRLSWFTMHFHASLYGFHFI